MIHQRFVPPGLLGCILWSTFLGSGPTAAAEPNVAVVPAERANL